MLRRTLPSMKRCTQCRSVLYCSRECQTKHWPAHKGECKQLPQDMRERAHKLADKVKLAPRRWGVEGTPSWMLGAPSDLNVARMEHGGAETRGKFTRHACCSLCIRLSCLQYICCC